MGLYSDLSAWALVGGGVHHLARGIQGQPLRFRPLGYMYSAIAFVGFGLVVDGVRKKQLVFRQRRLDALLEAREARGLSFARKIEQ
ncbi:hypothetical protein TRVA0_031S00760 [Trichomonascus vanleenenianus]|uniref:uncharacterized protein n=1 Tax=Trichomonascus vanleenenianus TaxID=2268995 RepID=UPI003ECAF636